MTTDRSFLAPPQEVSDWRMVLLLVAAVDSGLLEALPGRPNEIAGRLGLEGHAVMLEALALYGIVEAHAGGTFSMGPSAPDADATATFHHHARSLVRWAHALDDRLRGVPVVPGGPPSDPERWLDSLAVHARGSAPVSVDACLAHLPDAKAVFDLGGATASTPWSSPAARSLVVVVRSTATRDRRQLCGLRPLAPRRRLSWWRLSCARGCRSCLGGPRCSSGPASATSRWRPRSSCTS